MMVIVIIVYDTSKLFKKLKDLYARFLTLYCLEKDHKK